MSDNLRKRFRDDDVDLSFRESDRFEFLVRVQATCSKGKTDTYFANERDTGARVFVKGPYGSEESANVPLKVARLKELCFASLSVIDSRAIQLLPDFFPDVPLGVRHGLKSRSIPCWFIVSTCLVKDDPIPVRTHQTNVWGNVEVVDWSKVTEPTIPDPLRLRGHSLKQWILNILFRYAVGIPDFADRNFMLMSNGEVISVDEEGFGRVVNMKSGLKKKRCELIRKFVTKHKEDVLSVTAAWLRSVREHEAQVKEILEMQDVQWLIERLTKLQDTTEISNLFASE